MAASTIALTTTGGGDPFRFMLELEGASRFTVDDGLYAGQLVRSIILERTARGVDVNGAPFAPYSTKGPYYLYPNRETGSGAHRAVAAKNRLRATGGKSSGGVRTPYGIRYDSYAAAKAAHGRSGVDLIGLDQHPHMLATILVRCGGAELGSGAAFDLTAETNAQPANEFEVGFYGPEAARAKGNNEGVPSRRLPARRFFDISKDEMAQIAAAVNARRLARMKAVA